MNLGTHIDGEDDITGEPSDAQIIEAVRGGDIGDFALLWRCLLYTSPSPRDS